MGASSLKIVIIIIIIGKPWNISTPKREIEIEIEMEQK